MRQDAVAASLPKARFLVAATPVLFVLIWSTGFVVAKFGLPYAPPLTFLTLRFIGVLAVLMPIVVLMRAPWPSGNWRHIAVAGVMLQAGYLGGVWCAIKLGMPAGLCALIAGMQPVLTAFAAPLLNESLIRKQWLGLVLGLSGVALVVATKMSLAGLSWASLGLCLFALFAITAGTLYQKRFCPQFDLRSGTLIQFAASLVVLLPLAIWFEGLTPELNQVEWHPRFVGALLWSVFALSIGAIFLLFLLIRKNAATQVTSLMYLTPPTTALMAWVMFGEAFSMSAMLGMALAVLGVALVVRRN